MNDETVHQLCKQAVSQVIFVDFLLLELLCLGRNLMSSSEF